MTDEYFAQNPPPSMRRRSGGKGLLLAAFLVFVLGAAAIAAAVWTGKLDIEMGRSPDPAMVNGPQSAAALPAPAASLTVAPSAAPAAPQGTDARLAALEARVAELDLREAAASGNAARAEGLLIAFAARRALDRGAPLGYLEDQLRLRFADSQPHAVDTVVAAAAKPVTIDQLLAGLDALGAAAENPDRGLWQRFKGEVAGLFVIRRSEAPVSRPADRIDRARLLLQAGKLDQAINEVRAFPGSAAWVESARRYDDARRALDLIETTALIGTRELKDASGKTVEQPSPVVPPAPKAAD